MTGFSIKVEGLELADQALASAVRRLDDPLDLFTKIGAKMLAATQERFDREVDPEGSPWPQSLRVRMEGGKTLTDTARLAGSINFEASSRSVEIGSNAIYAAIHQFGGVIKAKTKKGLRFRPIGGNADMIVKSVTMPRRAFLGINDEDLNEIQMLAGTYIAGAFGQGGLDGNHAG